MTMLMIRSKIKPENAADLEVGAEEMFAAIEEAAPQGVRYASCRLPDGVSYVALLDLEDDADNPLAVLPAFQKFQASLKDWLAEPPTIEPLTFVGSYRL